jgi:hypothetical protein
MRKFISTKQILNKIVCLSSAFLVVSAFSYSNPAYADIEGIPYNPDFPKAQYPYAQAPDGCSGWQSTREIRDKWGPVDFTGACNTHDKCYYTRGSNWNTCNERFYSDLRAACERDLRTSVRVPAPTLNDPTRTRRVDLPPDPARLSVCYSVATTYYSGVQAGVLFDVFKDAQNKQKRYEEWVASIRNPSRPQDFTSCLTTDLTKALVPCNQNPLPIYSTTYNPVPYRPGTSGWTGRIGKVAFNNGTQNSVRVTLYHPDAPERPFKSWTILPGQNIFFGDDNYGMDWGIQVNNSPVYILGRVSAWNNFNGQQIFQSGYPFWLHN